MLKIFHVVFFRVGKFSSFIVLTKFLHCRCNYRVFNFRFFCVWRKFLAWRIFLDLRYINIHIYSVWLKEVTCSSYFTFIHFTFPECYAQPSIDSLQYIAEQCVTHTCAVDICTLLYSAGCDLLQQCQERWGHQFSVSRVFCCRSQSKSLKVIVALKSFIDSSN